MKAARCIRALVLALLVGAFHLAGVRAGTAGTSAVGEGPLVLDPEGAPLFAVDGPFGPFDYRLGRGLRLGASGFRLGGYATVDGERLESGDDRSGLDVNLFVSADPVSFLHLFGELEIGEVFEWERGSAARAAPKFKAERLYGDATWRDEANLRLGKFLTPFGRWNQVLADPLLWTTSEPLVVERVFPDHVTGAMLFGSVFPGSGSLSYGVYGSFLGHEVSEPDRDAAGARLEWTPRRGPSIGASYFASAHGGEWNHLGGVDAFWQPLERLELSAEALAGEGVRADGGQWGLYAQAVIETVPTLYLVGRYEHFDPPGGGAVIDLFDVGVAWVPRYWVRVKADYRIADHQDELSAPGLYGSFSVLF